jgi:hypothetical protein
MQRTKTVSSGLAAIRDQCMALFKSENAAKYLREFLAHVGRAVYDEIYVYIWFICIYNVFLIFITLANLFMIQRVARTLDALARHAAAFDFAKGGGSDPGAFG